MAFENFLTMGGLQGALQGALPGAEPKIPSPAMMPGARPRGAGWRDIVGMIGDALLIGSGRQPIYRTEMQSRRTGKALGDYADNPQAAFENMLTIDPALAMQLLQLERGGQYNLSPGEVRYDRTGREIARGPARSEQVTPSTFERELEALGIDPRSPEARRLFYARNSPAGYLLRPREGDGEASDGAMPADDVPTINSQAEYDALPPGARYRDSQGNPGIKRGGPASSAPATFP